MNRSTSRRVLVGAILVTALAVRVWYVLATPGYTPSHDDRAFDFLARGIARSGAYPDVGHLATAYRPPAYSYFLGAIYSVTGPGHARITTARLVQAVVGTGTVALLGLLARRLFNWWTAIATMAVAAVYPPFIAVAGSLLSEPQALALELGAILAVLQWRRTGRRQWVLVAGALGGLLTLTRSNAFVVVIALAVGVWIGRPRLSIGALKPVAALLFTTVLVVSPWTIRNAVVLHSFLPVSDEAGGTLAGTYNSVSDHDRSAPASWHLLAEIPRYEAATRPLAGRSEPQFQSRLLHLALDYIRAHPGYPAKVAFWNTVRLLEVNPLAQSRYGATLSGVTSPVVGDATIYGFWVVAALALGASFRRELRARIPGFMWLALILLFLSIVLVNGEAPRLRLPLDPFIVLLAGAGIGTMMARLRGRGSRMPAP